MDSGLGAPADDIESLKAALIVARAALVISKSAPAHSCAAPRGITVLGFGIESEPRIDPYSLQNDRGPGSSLGPLSSATLRQGVYFSAVLTVVKLAFSEVPRPLTAAMMAAQHRPASPATLASAGTLT
jgi:hypothetical protein